jgi:predicted secreted protein
VDIGRTSKWPVRLPDQRSGKVVFLSHCLLNENTRYFGGAGRPGSLTEIVRPCLDQGVGIVQLPCPEEHAWGGVTKRWLLAFYGAELSLMFRLRAVLLPLMLFYTRRVYRRLARQVANQVHDYAVSGFRVLGIIGVDASPSCGVQTTLHVERAFDQIGRLRLTATAADMNAIVRANVIGGRGLFVAALQDELSRRGLEIPFSAHDLIAELEGRARGAAFEQLVSAPTGCIPAHQPE